MTDWCDGCGIKTIVYPVNPHGETIYCCKSCIDKEGWLVGLQCMDERKL